MSYYYYTAASDTTWDTLGNWWYNDAFTDPALELPPVGSSVVILNTMSAGPSVPTVFASLDVPWSTAGGLVALGHATCTQPVTFSGGATLDGDYTGDVTFSGFSTLGQSGNQSGNFILRDGCRIYGTATVTGTITFYDSSHVYSIYIIDAYCEFNNTSYIQSGASSGGGYITGTFIFRDASYTDSSLTGDCSFFNASYGSMVTFNGSVRLFDDAYVSGSVIYNDLVVRDRSSIISNTLVGGIAYIQQPISEFMEYRSNYNTTTDGSTPMVPNLVFQFPELDVLGTGLF